MVKILSLICKLARDLESVYENMLRMELIM
jgi:hypothetical protein